MSKIFSKTVKKTTLWSVIVAIVVAAAIVVCALFGFNKNLAMKDNKTLTVSLNAYVYNTQIDTVEAELSKELGAEYTLEGKMSGDVSEIVFVFEKDADVAALKTKAEAYLADKVANAQGWSGAKYNVSASAEVATASLAEGYVLRAAIAGAVLAVLAFVYVAIRYNISAGITAGVSALAFHQGRTVRSRSIESVVAEAKLITEMPDFKGYIHDIGGPTANFRGPACDKQLKHGVCTNRKCLSPTPCPNLKVDHSEYIELLEAVEALPRVKKVFIRSGIRFDYLLADPDESFFKKLVRDHVSGQLKVAPEHCADRVLDAMGKPHFGVYQKFRRRYFELTKSMGKEQYLVPYLMSSHPGSSLTEAVELAECLKRDRYAPEQVQDYYPTPGTASTVMYYTGIDPLTMKKVHVSTDYHEKQLQRALLQFNRPQNAPLVREALRAAGREDLIGHSPECLVRPEQAPPRGGKPQGARGGDRKPKGNDKRGENKRQNSENRQNSGKRYAKTQKTAPKKQTAKGAPAKKAKRNNHL